VCFGKQSNVRPRLRLGKQSDAHPQSAPEASLMLVPATVSGLAARSGTGTLLNDVLSNRDALRLKRRRRSALVPETRRSYASPRREERDALVADKAGDDVRDEVSFGKTDEATA
jgi:hypothetical protein